MKILLLFVLIALIVTGCAVDNPVGGKAESSLNSPADEAACVMRPRPVAFAIIYEETVELVKPPNPAAGDFTVDLIIRGEGAGLKFGPSELYAFETVDISTNPTTFVSHEAYITSTETGAKLVGWMEGFGYPKPEGGTKFDGKFHITSGTCEFEGATGEAEFWGETFDNPDGANPGWVRFKGYYVPAMPMI